MAQTWYRGNLASANIPFCSELWGRSVIVNSVDQNYDKTTLNAPGVVVDKGIPQVYYMHNCLPTNQGYQAVGYTTVALPFFASDFDTAYPIQVANQAKYIFVPALGKNYIFSGNTNYWQSLSPLTYNTPPVTSDTQVTTAFVQGETYIYYAKIGCWIYDNVNGYLVQQTLLGVDQSSIKGICAANGYAIVWTDEQVAWSSITDPLDFTPSLSTGAGGGNVNEAKGKIICCLQLVGGFLIYCENNVVGARYTGNAQFPYIIREVPGSSGISTLNEVSWHANLPYHITWSADGLTQIDLQSSNLVYPEVADFLAAKVYEDFNEGTLTLTTTYLSSNLYTNVTIIGARFLVLSYGQSPGAYTYAIVRDLTLNRYGKLKINHVSCFEWNNPSTYTDTTYGELSSTTYGQLSSTTYGDWSQVTSPSVEFKNSFAFLQADGTVKIVDFDISEATALGVMILGKFQLDRNDWVEHQEFVIDVVNTGNIFDYYIIPTYDGKTFLTPVKGYLYQSSPKMRRYKQMISGVNISCMLIGSFNAVSFLLDMTVGGKEN